MTLHTIIDRITTGLFKPLVPILIYLAFALFLYGGFKFVAAADNVTERKKAQNIMIWGIVGLFVMVSIWGIVNLLVGTFTLSTGGLNAIPLRTGQ